VRKPAGLILISAFTSIKSVAFDQVSILSVLLKDQLDNLEKMKKISKETKVLMIHGKKDALIPYNHSVKLREALPKNVGCDLVIP